MRSFTVSAAVFLILILFWWFFMGYCESTIADLSNMIHGQMVEDVRLSLMGENARVDWHGVMPGLFIGADALEDPIRQACKEN